MGFIPRPGHVTGATAGSCYRNMHEYVSIRAPVT